MKIILVRNLKKFVSKIYTSVIAGTFGALLLWIYAKITETALMPYPLLVLVLGLSILGFFICMYAMIVIREMLYCYAASIVLKKDFKTITEATFIHNMFAYKAPSEWTLEAFEEELINKRMLRTFAKNVSNGITDLPL